ncbi:MAG: DUF805 domain-containing protein, partial [Pseudomonadota bacterium]
IVLYFSVAVSFSVFLISTYGEEAPDVIENSDSINLVILILSIPLWWINFAANAKRFHDLDKSGWLQLIWFIPVIGPLISFIVLGFISGDHGDNDYGSPDNGSMFASSNGIFGESGGSRSSGRTGYFDKDDNQTPSRKGRTNRIDPTPAKSSRPAFGKRTDTPLRRQ